jgi:CBS domain-containing protein
VREGYGDGIERREGDSMPTAREIMTGNPKIVSVDDSIRSVAQVLADEDIGGVIVCNDEKRLQGIITDRDIAVEVVAAGKDPESVRAGDLLTGRETVTIGADDSVHLAIETMKDHAVRRLPVIDGHEVIGMVSQADLAVNVADDDVGDLLAAISSARDNTGRG